MDATTGNGGPTSRAEAGGPVVAAAPLPARRRWYRPTGKRFLITLLLSGVLGVALGQLYLAVTVQPPAVARQAADPRQPAQPVTRYPVAERGDPLRISGTTLTGRPLSLAGLRGRVVVLNVWASWCPPCRREAPILAAVSKQYAGSGVSFVGINVRDNRAFAIAFEKKYGITYPSIQDPAGRAVLALNSYVPVNAIPVTLVLDREGRVAARVVGVVERATLSNLLDTVLAERAQ